MPFTKRILTSEEIEQFKRLYLEENYTAKQLRVLFKLRGAEALKLANSISPDYSRSKNNQNRKLTKYQVIKILISYMRDGVMQKDLAEMYGVSACNICNICNGRAWKHVFQGAKKKYNIEILSIRENA